MNFTADIPNERLDAFVSREYRLVIGQTEQFVDMLFYNILMHCYVVVEVKV